MSSPLPTDTLLQNRYRILKLLAQGGFAQTYLADDQGRFGEPCVVKEFCLHSSDTTVFEKAKELFQREAQTLYRLAHPQVPRFRAIFTEEIATTQRLFLVQDYVEGETYRAVLGQRSQQNHLFSETEVRQLLAQLLPVLTYVHGQGIIHRDLSLDNLILRSTDQKPVLIDFGVVKTVVTQLQRTNVMPTGTMVGKFGYAPVEQIQSGRAYPSSDLYSLAVCCLVLLTGREPSQLFDDAAATWNWRPYAAISDELAGVLDRMLAHRPSDRYATAAEVLQALQSDAPPPPPPIHNASPPPAPDLSQVRTMAVGKPAIVPAERSRQPPVIIPPVRKAQVAPQPARNGTRMGALIFAGLITAVLSAGTGWLVMQFLMLRPWDKTPPQVSPSPSSAAVETRSPQPPVPTIRYSQSLDLVPGKVVTAQDTLQPGETQPYRFEGNAGEELSAQLNGSGLVFSLLRTDLTPLSSDTQNITRWQGSLPTTDSYYIRVQNAPTGTVQSFQLTLGLSRPTPEPIPTPSPTVSPSPSPTAVEPVIEETALALGPNTPPQQLSGQLAPAHIQRYTVTASTGQALSTAVLGDQAVTLTIRNPAGQPLSSAENVLNWESLLSEPGTYQIDVAAIDNTKPTAFTIEIGLQQP
jgi:serine/threonine-protein kinase